MGHLLATSNPEAAARVNGEGRPLPGIGETVVYHPRPGEMRRGRLEVPAIVVHRDAENRRLELLVFYDSGDEILIPGVPERVGDDRGWSRVRTESLELHETIAKLTQQVHDLTVILLGEYDVPPESVLAMLDSQDERVGRIEESIKAGGPAMRKPAKRQAKALSGKDTAAEAPAADAGGRRRFRRG